MNIQDTSRPWWRPVSLVTGGQGVVSAKASLRAFYLDGTQEYFKGVFTLDRWGGTPTRYRISFDGFDGYTGLHEAGTIELPRSGWTADVTKGRSENMQGRVLILSCNSNDTRRGLEKLQITIPTITGGHRAAKTMIEAFNAANIELNSGDCLVGHSI